MASSWLQLLYIMVQTRAARENIRETSGREGDRGSTTTPMAVGSTQSTMVILQTPPPHLQTGTHGILIWNGHSRMLQSNPCLGRDTFTKPGCSHGHESSMTFLWCSCLNPVKEPQHHPSEPLILPKGKGPLENQNSHFIDKAKV